MDVARPYTAVSPTVDGDVLHVLAGTNMALTGRQIALLTGRTSHSGVLASLNRLTEHGLVTRVELNRAYLFALNRDHLAAPAVEILAGMRVKLIDTIRDELAEWAVPPVYAWLFGSTARGDGDTASDIDVLLIYPDDIDEEDPAAWRQWVDALKDKIERWTGNRASIFEKSESELARLVGEDAPIVSALRSDAIALAGEQSSMLAIA